jgi:hypothetical protein
MALNDGYAVDGQGRRIYFPPFGQPRLVPSTLDEAKFNGAVFTYGLVMFGLTFVIYLTVNAALEESGGSTVILALPLVAHYLAVSLRARRWPALDDPNYTYHRFVVSTLRRQNTGWLRWKLAISAILAIGLVLVVGWSAIKLQSEWDVAGVSKNMDRLVIIPAVLLLALFCTIHAYRIQIALRRQKEWRALGPNGEATS